MTPERTDLIAQLEKLTPTEGEWEFNLTYMMLNAKITTVRDDRTHSSIMPIGQIYTKGDSDLITLAPQMRLAILEMAKEIEELKAEKKRLQFIIDNGLGERDLTNDI